MKEEIVLLEKERWAGHILPMPSYTATEHYALSLRRTEDGFAQSSRCVHCHHRSSLRLKGTIIPIGSMRPISRARLPMAFCMEKSSLRSSSSAPKNGTAVCA